MQLPTHTGRYWGAARTPVRRCSGAAPPHARKYWGAATFFYPGIQGCSPSPTGRYWGASPHCPLLTYLLPAFPRNDSVSPGCIQRPAGGPRRRGNPMFSWVWGPWEGERSVRVPSGAQGSQWARQPQLPRVCGKWKRVPLWPYVLQTCGATGRVSVDVCGTLPGSAQPLPSGPRVPCSPVPGHLGCREGSGHISRWGAVESCR